MDVANQARSKNLFDDDTTHAMCYENYFSREGGQAQVIQAGVVRTYIAFANSRVTI
jgi:hypothetical protein